MPFRTAVPTKLSKLAAAGEAWAETERPHSWTVSWLKT
jgi:hypothetical protein